MKFEEALKRLENVVAELEKGNLPLEDSLKKFEEGIGLVRFLEGKLKETEQKIEILTKDKEGKVTGKEPFPTRLEN